MNGQNYVLFDQLAGVKYPAPGIARAQQSIESRGTDSRFQAGCSAQ